MPNLSEHPGNRLAKILAVGDQGTAKSGSLASLALAGFKLKIADFDNGIDVLVGILKAHPRWKEVAPLIEYETFTNEYEIAPEAKLGPSGQKITDLKKYAPRTTDAFHRGLKWISEQTKEGPDTFLVIDSLTMLSDRAMENIQALTGTIGKNPTQPEWGAAQSDVENFLRLMSSKSVGCNTIMFAHKTYIEVEGGISAPYPKSLGKALSPKIASYYNNMVGYVAQGETRKIITTPYLGMGHKTTAPTQVKKEYKLDPATPEKGLIDLVRDLGVEMPNA